MGDCCKSPYFFILHFFCCWKGARRDGSLLIFIALFHWKIITFYIEREKERENEILVSLCIWGLRRLNGGDFIKLPLFTWEEILWWTSVHCSPKGREQFEKTLRGKRKTYSRFLFAKGFREIKWWTEVNCCPFYWDRLASLLDCVIGSLVLWES